MEISAFSSYVAIFSIDFPMSYFLLRSFKVNHRRKHRRTRIRTHDTATELSDWSRFFSIYKVNESQIHGNQWEKRTAWRITKTAQTMYNTYHCHWLKSLLQSYALSSPIRLSSFPFRSIYIFSSLFHGFGLTGNCNIIIVCVYSHIYFIWSFFPFLNFRHIQSYLLFQLYANNMNDS